MERRWSGTRQAFSIAAGIGEVVGLKQWKPQPHARPFPYPKLKRPSSHVAGRAFLYDCLSGLPLFKRELASTKEPSYYLGGAVLYGIGVAESFDQRPGVGKHLSHAFSTLKSHFWAPTTLRTGPRRTPLSSPGEYPVAARDSSASGCYPARAGRSRRGAVHGQKQTPHRKSSL